METLDELPAITAIKELIIRAMEECTDADLLDLIYKLLCEAGRQC